MRHQNCARAVRLTANSDAAQTATAVEQTIAKFGRIDVVLNNAGYSLIGDFEELTTQEIERHFATNFWGVSHVIRAALPVMRNAPDTSSK